MPNNDDTTCQQCKFCDLINHAPIGTGEYHPGCEFKEGYYRKIEDWTKTCERFENRWRK